MPHRISLVRLKPGIKVKIIEIASGKQMTSRLSSMGVRPGVCVTKISSFVLEGPITIKVGRTTLALGHTMAQKIIVDARPELCS